MYARVLPAMSPFLSYFISLSFAYAYFVLKGVFRGRYIVLIYVDIYFQYLDLYILSHRKKTNHDSLIKQYYDVS